VTSIPAAPRRPRPALAVLALLLLALLLPAAPARSAAPAQLRGWVGRYSPNTTVELRGPDLWFVRSPYQSRLLLGAADTFVFEAGWLAGRAGRFARAGGGVPMIELRGDDGQWREFARMGQAFPELGVALIGDLGRALEQAVAESGAPGAALYVHVPGRGTWAGARGLADIGRGVPLVPDDRMRIASVTKSFVAVVALQLVQEGWLALDQTVEHWLPGLVPGGERITVRQLLSHTSGLPDYMTGAFVGRARRETARVWAPRELVAEALRRPRLFAPGAPGRWAYANTNYILLGMIVERVTGNSLETELQQRIVGPLGLARTAMAAPSADTGDLARGYVGREDYTALNPSFAWAAGGIVANAPDVGRFARALFGGELLRPETLALMQSFGPTGGGFGVADLGYGLGLMQRTLPADAPAPARLARGHTGGLAGYRSVMWHLPANGVTLVVLVNRYESDPNLVARRAIEVLRAHGALGR